MKNKEYTLNVSECRHLHTSDFNDKAMLCDIAYSLGIDCLNYHNCYFKQLKRKEQELQQLKNDIECRTFCVTCTKENENARLNVEKEKCKQALEEIKKFCEQHTLNYSQYKISDFILEKINETEKE